MIHTCMCTYCRWRDGLLNLEWSVGAQVSGKQHFATRVSSMLDLTDGTLSTLLHTDSSPCHSSTSSFPFPNLHLLSALNEGLDNIAHSPYLTDKNVRPWKIKSPSCFPSHTTNEWPTSCWELGNLGVRSMSEAPSVLSWHSQGVTQGHHTCHWNQTGREDILRAGVKLL